MNETAEPPLDAAATLAVGDQAAAVPPKAQGSKGRGGFAALTLGGVVAGTIGFAAGQVWPLLPAGQQVDPTLAQRLAEVEALAKEQASALAEVQARLQGIEAAAADGRDALIQVEQRLQGLAKGGNDAEAIAALQADVARLKSLPPGAVDDKGLRAQLDALLQEARNEAKAIGDEARQAAALERLQGAAESGAPFASSLSAFADVPADLANLAESGIPTLARLQGDFPDAARLALEAALTADMGESWTERTLSFLQSTTKARSLTPREGSDPDAVLSRMEAALRLGDLEAVLSESEGLSPPARDAMASWLALANTRRAALAGLAALIKSLGGG